MKWNPSWAQRIFSEFPERQELQRAGWEPGVLGPPRGLWGCPSPAGSCDSPAQAAWSSVLLALGTGHGTNTPCRVCEQGGTAQLTAAPVRHTGVHSQVDLTLKILFSASSDSSICVAGQGLQTGVFCLGKQQWEWFTCPRSGWDTTLPGWVWEKLDREPQHWKFGTGCRTLRQQLQGRDRECLPYDVKSPFVSVSETTSHL